MKRPVSIPDPYCIRALMTGAGAGITDIENNGLARMERVARVTVGAQRALAPEGFVPRYDDPLMPQVIRRDRTFGRDRTTDGQYGQMTVTPRRGRSRT